MRVVKGESWKPSPKKRKPRRALVVGIDYKDSKCKHRVEPLEYAEKEAENVARILKDNGIDVIPLLGPKATFESVKNELKRGVDIFHFTGHGDTSRNKSKIFLCDKDLWAEEMEKLLASSPAPSLSFFNACETSVDIHKKGKVTWAPYNWAFALANQDGSIFIGTLWSVLEEEALRFAETFYIKFLGAGDVLAEAMRQARNEAKKRKSDAIFSWPAYILYGPPTLKKDDLLPRI